MRKVLREEILTGNPIRIMFQLGLPIMITQIFFTFYNMADTFWLGHLPPTESGSAVAGLQVAFPIIWFLISFTLGFGFAGTAFVSQYTGANDQKNANRAASQVVAFLTLAG
ncbi:MAG: MATE family efflux transporter, partial [Caldisericum exile]